MVSSHLVTQADLMEWLDRKRAGDLERLLKHYGCRYWRGAGGVIATTRSAIDSAMLGRSEVQFREKKT